MALLVADLDWPGDEEEAIRAALAERLGVEPGSLDEVLLVRKSLDARHGRQRWKGAWRVTLADEDAVLARSPASVRVFSPKDEARYGFSVPSFGDIARRSWPDTPVAVVGAGPAGLFAALRLAEAGARVVLFDRGGPMEDRVSAVNGFWRGRAELDHDNNLLFGEGGAGAFSDGKVYTRRRDGDLGYLFRRLVDFGADPEILQDAWAHLGTDKIRRVLPVFRERLRELGVDVRYHTRVVDLHVEAGTVRGVVLDDGTQVDAHPVVVATGHSARDAYRMLVDAGAAAESRPISVGARIEHPQALIDQSRYGRDRGADLPSASYRLAYSPKKGRSTHTFCMCPGGVVVPAVEDVGQVVVNGMSFAARRGKWANSAVIVEVHPDDYGPGTDPLRGLAWQAQIERAAWNVGGGSFAAPAQRVEDLLLGRASTDVGKTSYPLGVVPTDLREVLPDFIVEAMGRAIRAFDRKVAGFAGGEGVLIAPETRTTAPLRFLRDEQRESTTLPGLYPVGEGAGYGGGIISSALDGYRAALSIEAQISAS